MTFLEVEPAAVARSLDAVSRRAEDTVEAYFERLEVCSVRFPDDRPGLSLQRQEGLSVRLVRGRQMWMASRDGLEAETFATAIRQVARQVSQRFVTPMRLQVGGWPRGVPGEDLLGFPLAVQRALRSRHLAFPYDLEVRAHRRWIQVVRREVRPEAEMESYYSVAATLPGGRVGSLLTELGEGSAETVAQQLAGCFRARQAASPSCAKTDLLLAPAAAAVFLHEAVAHALEVDTLAAGGDPHSALGLQLTPFPLDVLDDPSAAPEGVRRYTDDEGLPAQRRWLLREGRVSQPLADESWAKRHEHLMPGAARRQGRHDRPVPRSYFLDLLSPEGAPASLVSQVEEGLWAPEVERGRLDPRTGLFRIDVPHGRRLRDGKLREQVGPFRLEGRVADLLGKVAGIGGRREPGGAGWCAKGGQRLPVWARAPQMLLAGVEVRA